MPDPHLSSATIEDARRKAGEIHEAWNRALATKNVDAAAALYAEDAVLESPLARHLLRSETGICRGREAIRDLIRRVFERQPAERRTYKTDYFTDGRRLIWEYPRQTPDGDQMDFAESMDLENGLIKRHRVYWGWFGLKLLAAGAHGPVAD